MKKQTLDIESSAELLGIKPEALREMAERDRLQGVVKVDHQWRISVFTLAKLLNTPPAILLGFLEDIALGELMDQIEADDFFEEEEAHRVYQTYMAEAEAEA